VIEESIVPAWGLVLVRTDPISQQVGIGLGGKPLVGPETMRAINPWVSGVIKRCGPSVDGAYAEGDRIMFGREALTVLEREGVSVRDGGKEYVATGLLDQSQIMATFPGLPEDMAATSKAVERRALPEERGGVLLPNTYTEEMLSAQADVLAVHPEAQCRWREGDVVLLGPSVTRAIHFGYLERTLFVVKPIEIQAEIVGPAVSAEPEDASPLHYRGAPVLPMDDRQYDEGDPRAPQ
jgi:hypothetical protein